MKSLVEYMNSVITGNDSDNFVLSSPDDKIEVAFKYKDEEIMRSISYKDIEYKPGSEQWSYSFKSPTYKDINYVLSGDYTGTGRFGISTINAILWVKRKDDVIDKITPKVGIVSNDMPLYGNTFDQIL